MRVGSVRQSPKTLSGRTDVFLLASATSSIDQQQHGEHGQRESQQRRSESHAERIPTMAETAGASASTPSARKPRGANPSADYKSLFLKSKDKYDRVSTDHADLVANVGKAALKQQKLREELDFLLDVIASKQAQRVRIEQAHRDRALELEREAAAAVAAAAAARQHASSLGSRDGKRDRGAYDSRYDAADDYRPYSARYADDASYPAYEAADRRRYASPPPHPSRAVAGSSSSQRGDAFPASDASPPRALPRDPYAPASYRHPTSQSPPVAHRARAYDQPSPPFRHEAHRAYRESTPPLPPPGAGASSAGAAVKRPRPTSVERELLETGQGYDEDPRDRTHHTKRARND
ncbi:hypothetical protein PANT_19d00030 [Moesziomyces antarcticus T-34]|uniref:Uncharacterized protein n=1 Tax=Pseudozyma antarctica (strain T-34) TaxID=1151754 RepID=M9MF74_PSEA3|nr:hypothetical protein PANT_19d00030 [Moesziomyces antarcticus T-34]